MLVGLLRLDFLWRDAVLGDEKLLNLGLLADLLADVVELGAANLSGPDNLDLIDARGVHGENALNAHTVGSLADREGFPDIGILYAKDKALIELNSLGLALDDLKIDANRIADMIVMNCLQAIGKAVPALILSTGRQGLYYIPLIFILNALFGFNGFIYTQAIVDFLMVITATLMLRHVIKTDPILHESAVADSEGKNLSQQLTI